jgi:carboxylate-amine ligase
VAASLSTPLESEVSMLEFHSSPRMTMGVEIELQMLDAITKDLTAAAPTVLEILGPEEQHIRPEIFRAMVEINTGICHSVADVRRDLESAVRRLRSVCLPLGVELAGGGSHPFARYRDRLVYPSERFEMLIDRNRWIARRLMIFGLHLHLGMPDGNHAMNMINALLPYLPHALALSASSPFWQGSDTGLASSRITIFESLPTAGTPCTFDSWGHFQRFFDAAVCSRAVGSIKDLWWDIRPHPDLGTIELRVCDGLATISEAVNLVAFLQALAVRLDERLRAGERFRPPASWVIRENKWRASRWGIEAEIVLDETGSTALLLGEIERLLEELEPWAGRLGTGPELRQLGRTVAHGLSYERQRAIHDLSGSLVPVTEALIEEFRTDRPLVE